MYEESVKRLRELQVITEHCSEQSCSECSHRELCDKYDNKTLSGTYKEAADAIEELIIMVGGLNNALVETVNDGPRNTVHLCASCEYQYPDCPADEGVVFGCGKGNDNICQCQKYVAKTPRWFSVKDKLPENGVAVIVTDGIDVGEGMRYQRQNETEVWFTPLADVDNITHWQPMPELPKEET